MKKFIKPILIILTLCLLLIASPASSIFAIDVPNSISLDSTAQAFRSLLEPNDMLIIVGYNIAYYIYPEETAYETFIGRVLDSNGLSIAATRLFAYYEAGYSEGVFSLYMNAETAPVWGSNIQVSLSGNPTLDWSGPIPNTSTNIIEWNNDLGGLTSFILDKAYVLSNTWNVDLLLRLASGIKLSDYGDVYFSSVVPNLRQLCPDLYADSSYSPAYKEAEYSQNYLNQLWARWDTTPYAVSFANLAEYFNLTSTQFRGVLAFILLGVASVAIAGVTQSPKPLLIIILPTIFMLNLMGMLSLLVTAILGFASVLLLGYILFYKGAS